MDNGRLIKRIFAAVIGFAALWIAMAGVSCAAETVDNGIPVMYVTVNGTKADIEAMNQSEDHSVSCEGTVSIDVPDDFRYCDMPTEIPCEDLAERAMTIRGRGNSTWRAEKKPYKLKLENKADLFGLGENKHWVLLANAYDKTLMKDRITAWLGDEIGMAYTPRGYPVDLVMRSSDGTYDEYLGSYYLSEQVRVGKNRVDIDELEEDDVDDEIITGGYLIQNGMQTDETSPSYFETKSEEVWANHTPNFDPDDDGYVNDKQRDYIRGYMQDLEDAIMSADYEGVDGPSYRDMMDLESAAKYWLIDQACKNADGYGTGSTYLYKPRDDKMYWGPLWDYDYAWYYHSPYEDFLIQHAWLSGMFYDTGEGGFVEEIKKQWPAVRAALLRLAEDGGIMDQYYEETKRSQAADLEMYPEYDSWSGELIEFDPEPEKELFKEWILNRVAWMDAHLDDLDNIYHKVTIEVDGVEVDHMFIHDDYAFYYFLTAPEKEDYVWVGWQLEDGTELTEETKCDRDMTVTPVYASADDLSQLEDIIFRTGEDYVNIAEGSYEFEFTLIPEDAEDKTVKWTSSDEEIASIRRYGNGFASVTLKQTGDVTFTATLRSGATKTMTLHVIDYTQPNPEAVNTDQDQYELVTGGHGHIEATPDPADAKYTYVSFEAEDDSIVEVDRNGVMKALKPGRTFVTVLMEYVDDDYETVTIEKRVEIVVSDPEPEPEISYHCVEGDGQTWRKGTGDYLKFVFKRTVGDDETFDHFKGIKIDGKDLTESDYTAKSGSVVINVNPDYLETLDTGNHTLTAAFDDADDAQASFKVVSAEGNDDGSGSGSGSGTGSGSNSSGSGSGTSSTSAGTGTSRNAGSTRTGDSSSVLLWIALMLAAAAVLIRQITKAAYRR